VCNVTSVNIVNSVGVLLELLVKKIIKKYTTLIAPYPYPSTYKGTCHFRFALPIEIGVPFIFYEINKL